MNLKLNAGDVFSVYDTSDAQVKHFTLLDYAGHLAGQGINASGSSLTLSNDAVTTDILADEAVTEDKLNVFNSPNDGNALVWDNTNSRLQWDLLGADNFEVPYRGKFELSEAATYDSGVITLGIAVGDFIAGDRLLVQMPNTIPNDGTEIRMRYRGGSGIINVRLLDRSLAVASDFTGNTYYNFVYAATSDLYVLDPDSTGGVNFLYRCRCTNLSVREDGKRR